MSSLKQSKMAKSYTILLMAECKKGEKLCITCHTQHVTACGKYFLFNDVLISNTFASTYISWKQYHGKWNSGAILYDIFSAGIIRSRDFIILEWGIFDLKYRYKQPKQHINGIIKSPHTSKSFLYMTLWGCTKL